MHRIDSNGAGEDGQFLAGNPAASEKATEVTPEWLTDIQENLCLAIESAGLNLVKGDYTQLTAAIAMLSGVGAGAVKRVTFADSPYAVQSVDGVILADCTAGVPEIHFIDAGSGSARRVTVKKIDESNNPVKCIPAAGDAIEGEDVSYDSVMPGEYMTFVPDGITDWHRVG